MVLCAKKLSDILRGNVFHSEALPKHAFLIMSVGCSAWQWLLAAFKPCPADLDPYMWSAELLSLNAPSLAWGLVGVGCPSMQMAYQS